MPVLSKYVIYVWKCPVITTGNERHDAFIIFFPEEEHFFLILQLFWFGVQSKSSRIHVYKWIFNCINMGLKFRICRANSFVTQCLAISYVFFWWSREFRVYLWIDLAIGRFYKVLFVIYYWCYWTLEHLKILILFLNTWIEYFLKYFCVFGLAR